MLCGHSLKATNWTLCTATTHSPGSTRAAASCHIQPDWLLIYRIKERLEILNLVDTGTHADLFGKNKR